MAGSKSDFLENAILLHTYSASAFTAPTTIYVALFTTAASDGATGTEVTGGSYARASTTASSVNWGLSSTGTMKNLTSISYGTPSASWGTVVAAATVSLSTGGNMLHWGDLTTSKTINSGDTVSFAASAIVLTED